MPGVKAVRVIQDAGSEIQWAHDEIACVAAVSEDIARDAVRAIRVEYEVLPHFVTEEHVDRAPVTKPGREKTTGDPDTAFGQAAVTVEHALGIPMINHCCLEPHGQVTEWEGDNLTAWASTQAVSTLAFQFAGPLEIPASNVHVMTEYMGGGFGSKFSVERVGIEGARISRLAGAPVKMFLERDHELAVGGHRPSAWAKIKAAADSEGNVIAWDSQSWGSGGLPGTGSTPLPYVFKIPNSRVRHVSVPTNLCTGRGCAGRRSTDTQ